MTGPTRLPWDWHAEPVPPNVSLHDESFLETSYSFHSFRSRRDDAVVLKRGASVYLGTTFDLGPMACVTIGEYSMLNAAQLVIDGELNIGDHVLVSWGVVIMDTYRVAVDPDQRRRGSPGAMSPVTIASDCWIGFGASLLPGASLGRGAIVAARSVVTGPVAADTVVAGNPASPIGRTPEVRR